MYLNPPWKLWSETWDHAKQQMEAGTIREVLLVIPNSHWNGWGNLGKPKIWCGEVDKFEKKKMKRVFYAFSKPDGTRYDTRANLICVHLTC